MIVKVYDKTSTYCTHNFFWQNRMIPGLVRCRYFDPLSRYSLNTKFIIVATDGSFLFPVPVFIIL